MPQLPPDYRAMTEKALSELLIGTNSRPGPVRFLGWEAYHTLYSKGSAPGWPDWCLVRERIVYLELKTEKGIVSDSQRTWLTRLANAGGEVYVIRPSHVEQITRVLNARRREPGVLVAATAAATLEVNHARSELLAELDRALGRDQLLERAV